MKEGVQLKVIFLCVSGSTVDHTNLFRYQTVYGDPISPWLQLISPTLSKLAGIKVAMRNRWYVNRNQPTSEIFIEASPGSLRLSLLYYVLVGEHACNKFGVKIERCHVFQKHKFADCLEEKQTVILYINKAILIVNVGRNFYQPVRGSEIYRQVCQLQGDHFLPIGPLKINFSEVQSKPKIHAYFWWNRCIWYCLPPNIGSLSRS